MNETDTAPAVIPAPVKLTRRTGNLALSAATRIAADAAGGFPAVAKYLAAALEARIGGRPVVGQGAGGQGGIRLTAEGAPASMAEEAYRLSTSPDGAVITARTSAGAFRGAVTLLQLLPPEGRAGSLPCVEVEDSPRFAWRGLMLDCARYFYPKECVLQFLDMMALHKLNVFHWHLTEDQGWRIEIRAYPTLTEVGAWRRETIYGHNRLGGPGDGCRHGGFYTQDDVREIVAYAAERFITVVPEIEMPGHAQAALASYPELACVETPLEVSTHWGIHKNVFNAGKDEVFVFLEKVLDEVLGLFPSKYVHIGGDECPKDQWKQSTACQERIRREGLADEDELQSWFVRRIEKFLNARDRRLVGWDEILEGGLAPNATVMSWRGEEGGVATAKAGHDVVMTPNKSVYFDYYQGEAEREPLAIGGMLPLEKVYEYEPVPKELSAAEARHVLGAQGNVWTEYMPSFKQVQYMTLPRAAALAEVTWSPKEARNLDDFRKRLAPMFARYRANGWIYRPG